jgi:hypothetical protein
MQTNEAFAATAAISLQKASPAVIRRVLRELLADDGAAGRPAAEQPHGNGQAIAPNFCASRQRRRLTSLGRNFMPSCAPR